MRAPGRAGSVTATHEMKKQPKFSRARLQARALRLKSTRREIPAYSCGAFSLFPSCLLYPWGGPSVFKPENTVANLRLFMQRWRSSRLTVGGADGKVSPNGGLFMPLITESGPDTLPIGAPAPDFSLPATDGKTYSLRELAVGKKAVVVNFTCNHCPYAKAYEDRFMAIVRDYSPRGIAFVAINPNDAVNYPEDSFEKMKERAAARGFNFPYLRDESQQVAKAYGAVCTPHLFIVVDGKIAYEGRIDDNWKDPAAVKRQDLRDALDAILAGKPIPHPNTNPLGCSIKWKS